MHNHIDITTEACLDIAWRLAFLPSWDGYSYSLETHHSVCHCTQMHLAQWAGVLQAKWTPAQCNKKHVERTLCNCLCCTHLGLLLVTPESLDNLAVVGKVQPVPQTSWPSSDCYIFVLSSITYM